MFRPRRVSVDSGGRVYLCNRFQKTKLNPKVTTLWEMLETAGKPLLIDQDGPRYKIRINT